MSSHHDTAINPRTGRKERVLCMDDYFGRHRYGYRFDGEEHVYREGEIEFAKQEPRDA